MPYFLISREAPRKRNKAKRASEMAHKTFSASGCSTERECRLYPGYDGFQKQILKGHHNLQAKESAVSHAKSDPCTPAQLQKCQWWLTSGCSPQPLFLELQHLVCKTLSFLTDEVCAGDPYIFKKDLSCVRWPHTQFVYLFSNMNAWKEKCMRKTTKNRSTVHKYNVFRKKSLQMWMYVPRQQWNLRLGKT